MKVCFLFILLSYCFYSCKCPKKQDKTTLKEDLITDTTKAKIIIDFPFDTLIKNKELALAIAEPILFNVFGKKEIESKLPYHCTLNDGDWSVWVEPKQKKDVITFGGANGIVLRAKNGEIISLIRTK